MKDDFENIEDKDSGVSNKDKLNGILSYIPFLNIWMLFAEKQGNSEITKKFNRQGIAIFLIYIVLFILASFIGLGSLVTVAYVIAIIFFATKAYNGIYVEVEFLDKIIEKFNKPGNK